MSPKTASKTISKIMKKIIKELEQPKIRFKFRNDLLYYIFDDKHEKLCIFHFLKQKMFRIIYDLLNHDDFYKIYDRLLSSIYI